MIETNLIVKLQELIIKGRFQIQYSVVKKEGTPKQSLTQLKLPFLK